MKRRSLLYYVSSPKLVETSDLNQVFHQQKLPTSVYIGFDPTAESIHLGNYMGLVALTHMRLGGFKPIVLYGGATGLVGDPSGRMSERDMLSEDQVHKNIEAFEK